MTEAERNQVVPAYAMLAVAVDILKEAGVSPLVIQFATGFAFTQACHPDHDMTKLYTPEQAADKVVQIMRIARNKDTDVKQPVFRNA